MAESTSTVPGWYGKLPNLGDFASRRLPDDFIKTWDAWLQNVLQATRLTLGESWVDCYLTMPIWRFVLLPALVGSNGWAGVLMPSVDRVGRQFPLTLAVPLASYAPAAHAIFGGGDWFAGLEEAALTALDLTRSHEDFDRVVADQGFTPPPPTAEIEDSSGAMRRLPSTDGFERLMGTEALRAWSRHAGWNSLWWTRGRVDADPLMLACPGLPTAEEFGWLLESRVSSAPGPCTADAALSDG